MEINGVGINFRSFFLYMKVIKRSILLVSISTPSNRIVDLDFLSGIKNGIILKGPCFILISSVLLIRRSMSPAYLE